MSSVSIRADVQKIYGNTITEVIYSDLPTNLDVHPFSGDLSRLTNQNAINASLRHIVMTIAGQRPYSIVGSTVNYSTFQLFNPVQSEILNASIKNAISSFEPRVSVQNVIVTQDTNNEYIIIQIQYMIINISGQVFSTQILIERNR